MNAKELKEKSLPELKELAKEAKINPMQKPAKLVTQLTKHFSKLEAVVVKPEVDSETIVDKVETDDLFSSEQNETEKLSEDAFNEYVYLAYNSKLNAPINPSYKKYLISKVADLDELSAWLRTNYIK